LVALIYILYHIWLKICTNILLALTLSDDFNSDSEKGYKAVKCVKGWIEGRLGYNCANDRYGLLESDLWVYDGFHCGDCLQILVDGEWIDTSMEMSWEGGKGEWYLTGTPFKGTNLEYIQARIPKYIEEN
jgi:hypothetical protein